MNHPLVTLVTNEPPHAKLGGTNADIPMVQLGGAALTFDVQLIDAMTTDEKAAWCIGFAKDLTDLAAQIMQDATVTA